jgi:hypothetical protein
MLCNNTTSESSKKKQTHTVAMQRVFLGEFSHLGFFTLEGK